jgi:hypothetical protein
VAQYTHCAELSDWEDHWGGQGPIVPLLINSLKEAVIHGLLGALAGGAIGLLGGGIGVAIGAAVGGYIGFSYGFVEGFCDQWLNWRLICVQRDQCAIGHVAWIETMANKFGDDPIDWLFDNDLSFNLRLLPYTKKEFPRDGPAHDYGLDKIVADPFPAATLLRKPRKADGTEWDLSYKGYSGDDKPNHPGSRWTLHSEIEGNGMQTLCSIAKVLAILAPLTAVLGPIAGAVAGAVEGAVKGYNWAHDGCKKSCSVPIFCDIVCFLAGVVAAVVAGVIGAVLGAILGAIPGMGAVFLGAGLSLFVRHNGDFSDVQNDPASGNIEDEDCVIVWGDEVYDAGHSDGWVEIHPVRHLQKVTQRAPTADTTTDGFRVDPFKADVNKIWTDWCNGVMTAYDPKTKGAQQDPVNMWCLHPLVDGCRKHDEGPHDGGPH